MNSLRILIVDDDSETAELRSVVLSAAGHSVETLGSSIQAMDQLERTKPDLLIVDIMMPELDGLELTKRVRENAKLSGLKIIVMSAKAYEFDRKRAIDLGADGFIPKSIKIEILNEQITKIVEDKMTLTYWGVRGTLPVPGPGSLRYGGNTPCVTLEFMSGRMLIFDAGSGIKALSDHLMKLGRPRLEAKILITHPHWDHINALPFFVPLFIPGNEFEILGATQGDKSVRQIIAAQMDDVYFPITLKEFGARVFFRDLRQESFSIDNDIRIDTLLLSHPGYCLGYRVNFKGRSVCYVTDNELYLDDHPSYNPKYVADLTKFVSDADVLITDTTYFDQEYKTKVDWGHSCVSKVVELADAAKVKSLHLFHHDPDQDDDAIDKKLALAREALFDRNSVVDCIAPAEGGVYFI
jgi:phosphoribosyl 1,2-cyclic phosphodiesterase/ActR/RegA family two-component response regulator